MPQLEQISSFSSQIFWLFACLGIVYFFLARFAVPKLVKIIDVREGTISSNIKLATSATDDAKNLSIELEKTLSRARQESFEYTNQAAKEAAEIYGGGIAKNEEELKKHIEQAEKEIILKAEQAEKEVSGNVASFVADLVLKLSGNTISKEGIAKANLKKIVG